MTTASRRIGAVHQDNGLHQPCCEVCPKQAGGASTLGRRPGDLTRRRVGRSPQAGRPPTTLSRAGGSGCRTARALAQQHVGAVLDGDRVAGHHRGSSRAGVR